MIGRPKIRAKIEASCPDARVSFLGLGQSNRARPTNGET
jgi:hypothetical protein